MVAASWGSALVRHEIDPTCISGVARLADVNEGGNVVRLLLWSQAIQVWGQNPLLGTGAGGFIGAVYRQDIGDGHQPLDSWVHNTPLQLLAEFGAIAVLGIALIFLILLSQLVRRRDELTPEDGLCLTGLAVIGIHSLFEFPLWYVQFLVLAALFLGVLTRPGLAARSASVPTRAIVTVTSAGVLLGAVVIFVDYRKLERLDFVSELIQGIGTARVPEAQATLDEAAAQVRLFTQHRDYSVALARPLTREELESKIAVVDRSMGRMPNVNLIHVRILLAALDDDPETARLHLRRALKFHPQHTDSLVASLRSRIEARPEEFSALTPILDEELARRPNRRW